MWKNHPICNICKKDIKGGERTYIDIIYPERKGMTEIKAYLKNEAIFYCKDCISDLNFKNNNYPK